MSGDITQPQSLDRSGQERLQAFIARIERLEADKAELMADLKEVYAEAKSMGFDTKIMREVIRIRKMDAQDRAEQMAVLDLYLHALGEAPLFEAAGKGVDREAQSAMANFKGLLDRGEVTVEIGGQRIGRDSDTAKDKPASRSAGVRKRTPGEKPRATEDFVL